MKYFPRQLSILLGLFASVGYAQASTTITATADDLSGIVAAFRCSGALVTLGRADSERALILSAGHCTAPDEVYAPRTAVANVSLTGQMEYVATYPKPAPGAPLVLQSYLLRSIVYATMTQIDVTIFEAEVTIGELKSKGYRFYELADRLPKPGEKLRITSGLWGQTAECEVERILEDNGAQTRLFGTGPAASFRNSILLKSSCTARGGWSGAPLLDPKSGLIYGVISRITTPPGSTDGAGARVLISNVVDLRDCLSRDGKLAWIGPGCSLPRTH